MILVYLVTLRLTGVLVYVLRLRLTVHRVQEYTLPSDLAFYLLQPSGRFKQIEGKYYEMEKEPFIIYAIPFRSEFNLWICVLSLHI